jgi:hypothetical protein
MGAPADGKQDVTTRWSDQDLADIERFRCDREEETREDWSRNRAIRALMRLGFHHYGCREL